ncbi:hypothetical protein [Rossellomorea aquimaris]|jgi:membrane protein implicated in regulation of membrane protease activity|uniref:hypothetical protein n=1 Tax=Rossellomorea aquimaris TaxID=189382 RepID=UPI0024952212|nr:hypothetical protein [Rossellomorea aquimaris]
MMGLRAKFAILSMLLVLLAGLVILKLVVISPEDWVMIEEKYFPANDKKGAEGIKSGEVIDENSSDPPCSMKFDNGHTYKLDCDQYLDYKIGERVKIVSVENNYVKIRRK